MEGVYEAAGLGHLRTLWISAWGIYANDMRCQGSEVILSGGCTVPSASYCENKPYLHMLSFSVVSSPNTSSFDPISQGSCSANSKTKNHPKGLFRRMHI